MRIGIAVVGLLTTALITAAQTVSPIRKEGRYWVQVEEGSLPAGDRVRVSSTGQITVHGEPAQQVHYRVLKKLRTKDERDAERFFEQARLAVDRQGTTVLLTLDDPECDRCGFKAEMVLRLPRSTQETVLQTRGGSVTVDTLEGDVTAETAGGSIAMDHVGGAARAITAGGSIALGSTGGQVVCETAGGSIALDRGGADADLTTSGGSITATEVAGALRAETAGGSIRADKVGGRVVASTSGGSIHLGAVSGLVDAETAGGSIHVASAPKGVHAETAGGGIHLNNVAGAVQAINASGSIRATFLAGHPMADSFLETTVGTIVVWIPDAVGVNVDAVVEFATSVSRIQTEFGTVTVRQEGEDFGPGSVRASGAVHGGGPVLQIRNTSGRIQIRKAQ